VPGVSLFAARILGERGFASAITASDGAFVLEDLSPGPYELHFMLAGTALQGVREVEAPSSDVRIELEPGGTIRARVFDAESRAPIERFQAALEPDSSEDGGRLRSPFSPRHEGHAGRLTIDEVPVGTVTLTFRAEGYLPRRVERLQVTSASPAAALDIALERGATIRGRVTDEAGRRCRACASRRKATTTGSASSRTASARTSSWASRPAK